MAPPPPPRLPPPPRHRRRGGSTAPPPRSPPGLSAAFPHDWGCTVWKCIPTGWGGAHAPPCKRGKRCASLPNKNHCQFLLVSISQNHGKPLGWTFNNPKTDFSPFQMVPLMRHFKSAGFAQRSGLFLWQVMGRTILLDTGPLDDCTMTGGVKSFLRVPCSPLRPRAHWGRMGWRW